MLFVRNEKKEPDAAARWFRGLVQAIYSLEEFPARCPTIPEQLEFPFEIRHPMYFSHRIIFSIERKKERVVIYRVYHGARHLLSVEDLPAGAGS